MFPKQKPLVATDWGPFLVASEFLAVAGFTSYTSGSNFVSNLRMPSPRLRLSRTPTTPPQTAHCTKTIGNLESSGFWIWTSNSCFPHLMHVGVAIAHLHPLTWVKEYAPPLRLRQHKSKGHLRRKRAFRPKIQIG
jgi:hypothetical protein